jgi:hypothetical protein
MTLCVLSVGRDVSDTAERDPGLKGMFKGEG